MSWFKVDDGFWSHPKVLTMSTDATSLWVRAGAYSCQHLTDGFIASELLTVLGDRESAQELVDTGLWLDADGGFLFHDWGEYQETSEAVKQRRAQARERQRRARASRENRKDVTGDVTRDSGRDSRGCSQKVSTPDPTRPDPTSTPNGVESKPRERGGYSPDFETFWAAYPRKEAKRQAWKAWGKAIERATPERITAGASRYASDPNRSEQFTKHGSTWLNADGWDDEPLPAATRRLGPVENTLDAWSTPAAGAQSLDFIEGEVVQMRRALP